MIADERRSAREKVWPIVLEFCRIHTKFYSRDLYEFVEARLGKSAPDTAARRLGELREKGYVNYEVDGNHLFHITREPKPDLQVDFDFADDKKESD